MRNNYDSVQESKRTNAKKLSELYKLINCTFRLKTYTYQHHHHTPPLKWQFVEETKA